MNPDELAGRSLYMILTEQASALDTFDQLVLMTSLRDGKTFDTLPSDVQAAVIRVAVAFATTI